MRAKNHPEPKVPVEPDSLLETGIKAAATPATAKSEAPMNTPVDQPQQIATGKAEAKATAPNVSEAENQIRSPRGAAMKQRKAPPTMPKVQTGAPPASFLKTLEVKSSVAMLIERTRKQRESLAAQSTKEIRDRMRLELWELAARVRQIRFRKHGQLENAAVDLAAVASIAASILEERNQHLIVISTACASSAK